MLNKLEKKYYCDRYFCYFCLKGSYDTLAESIKDNNSWLCPYCTGACYCTRCIRNEKILQLVAYYFSMGGDINYLHDVLINKNPIIDKLFNKIVISDIYAIIYDKNLKPSEMLDNFMNYKEENKFEEEKEEKINKIESLKEYISKLNIKKKEFHNEFISCYQDKFEIKNIYSFKNHDNMLFDNISNFDCVYIDESKFDYFSNLDLDDNEEEKKEEQINEESSSSESRKERKKMDKRRIKLKKRKNKSLNMKILLKKKRKGQ